MQFLQGVVEGYFGIDRIILCNQLKEYITLSLESYLFAIFSFHYINTDWFFEYEDDSHYKFDFSILLYYSVLVVRYLFKLFDLPLNHPDYNVKFCQYFFIFIILFSSFHKYKSIGVVMSFTSDVCEIFINIFNAVFFSIERLDNYNNSWKQFFLNNTMIISWFGFKGMLPYNIVDFLCDSWRLYDNVSNIVEVKWQEKLLLLGVCMEFTLSRYREMRSLYTFMKIFIKREYD